MEKSSKNDIIQSVALEQSALSHILNAEGEKLQKAVAISSSINELLQINSSVTESIRDITMLEIVLYNKIKASEQKSENTNIETYGNIYICSRNVGSIICIFKNNVLLESGQIDCDCKYITNKLCYGNYIIKNYDQCGEKCFQYCLDNNSNEQNFWID